MEEPDLNTSVSKRKTLRKVLLILLILFIPAGLILTFLHSPIGAILLLLILIDFIVLVLISRKFYNWTLIFLFVILTAILYKSQRWPLSNFWFTLGFIGLVCISVYSAVRFIKKYNHNVFLKYIGFASSLILSIVSIGLLWKNMHWPLANLMLNVGLVVFIPFLFAFIFTLPGSNYINWSKSERVIFIRAIIIPMTFVYILCVLMFVFPDIYRLMIRSPIVPFDMYPVDLLNKMLIH